MAVVLALASTNASAGGVEYYHLDAVGNVRAVTDQAGNVVESHDYQPFGEECLTGPCAANPQVGAGQSRKFTGKERDSETGLDYFGARYYESKSGRFTTTDPITNAKASLVNPQRWNRYAYALNNPLRYIDPDGRLTFEADPYSKKAISADDIRYAKDAQTALRNSLTPQVKAYFQFQFGEKIESLLADDSGPVVNLSRGTLTDKVGQCKNGPGCQIELNLDYGVEAIQAGMLHELGHYLKLAGGKTYLNIIFDKKMKNNADKAWDQGKKLQAMGLLNDEEKASYYGEMYQFNQRVVTVWAKVPEKK
ncbi:MAG: RHS repeat-associated core domain-containing protein [Vicinamibacteria bacterium]|nr:RHS repeat-associated core domain-containing protein [Vicinamibacteria bacterium]